MSFYSDASVVMIPSGYKTSKVYCAVPTDGAADLSFSRSNDTATRVGPDGLIEKVRTNLLLQSNSFDTTWVSTRSNETSGQAGYDGTNNAWLLESTASPANEAYIRQTISASGSNTFSIYAKAGTSNFLGVYINATSGTDPLAYFNLSTGAVGTTSATATASIVSIGSGWYRCSIAYNATISNVDVYVTSADGSFLSTTGDNILIQAAQLETGDIATDYILTTTAAVSVGPVASVPRLDYLNSSCPRLLLEPQRQNVITFSEQMDNAAWTKTAAGTGVTPVVTANSAISPDGYQNADTIVFNVGAGTTSSDQSYINQTLSVTSGSTYSFSVYLKGSVGGEQLIIRSASGSYTLLTLSNEWQRFSVTAAAASTGYAAHFGLRQGVAGTLNSTATVYAYGAQVELGSYVSSYVNTLGAAVTRGADACLTASVPSLIGQTEGTMFIEFERKSLAAYSFFILSNVNGTTANSYRNSIYIYQLASSTIVVEGFVSNVKQFEFSRSALSVGTHKIAIAYKANDFALYIDGVQIGTDTSGSIPAMNFFTIAGSGDVTNTAQAVSQALLFKTRLTNAQLAELTTL